MKFKPIILIPVILILVAITGLGASAGEGGPVVVTAIHTSDNTQASHPGVFLTDSKADTYWAVNPNSGGGWVELSLNQPAFIHGLELSGGLGNGNNLILEYQRENGYWSSFLTGSLRNIPENGIIDLSYNQIVTGRIRLQIQGTNPDQARLNEVKICGQPASAVFHRINPRSVEASGHTSYLTRAEFLTDGNTYTAWMVKPRYRSGQNWLFETIENYLGIPINYNYNFNWPNRPSYYNYGEVSFDLGQVQTITNINIYFTNDARGDLTVEGLNDGVWKQIGFIPSCQREGWYRLPLNKVTASKIRLTMEATGHESVGGISEVEFWGYGAYTGSQQQELGLQTASLTTPVNRQFKLEPEKSRDHRLDIAVESATRTSLALDLNGKEYSAPKVGEINGQAVYSLPLTETMLVDDCNYLRIKPQPGTLTGLKLNYNGDGVQPHQTPVLNDGLLLTPGNDLAEEIIDLTPKTAVEQIEVYTSEAGEIVLSYQKGADWVTINPTETTPGLIRYQTPFTTGRLRLVNPSRIDLNEVRVLGSPITDRAPEVRLLRPEEYEVFDCDQLSDKYLVGFVDNPRAKVKVNGKDVFQIGHYFGCHLTAIGIPTWEETLVAAVATDEQGRIGRYETKIVIDKLPWVTLDQPAETVTTGNATYLISGELKKQYCLLKVNGQTVTDKKGRFNTQVNLDEGLNLIKIECVYEKPGNGNGNPKKDGFTQTVYRKVVRYSEQLQLQVTAPLNNSRTSASSLIVTGKVYGLTPVKVWVNGKPATVDGEDFQLPVTLTEGANTITVKAQDAGNRVATTTLTLRRDATAPLLTVNQPIDQAITNSAAVTISGIVADDSPSFALVNGGLVELTAGRFETALNLPEGWNQILIKAEDAAGNVTEKAIKVMVDTIAPAEFTPSADPSGWTNNNRPTISFVTTDETSGVDHYEIRVDDGTWITPVTSPYRFVAAVPDGERTIQVKAVDKAGNETIGEVKVYIDTVAPDPVYYILVPGNGYIELKWGAIPNSDIISYEITRTPAFSNGTIVKPVDDFDFITDPSGNKIHIYKDTSVQNGNSYVYLIRAIDRAGNKSSTVSTVPTKDGQPAWNGPTQNTPVTAGMIQQVIPQGTGGVVQFGSGGLLIPADFGYETRVTIYERSGDEFPGLSHELSPIVEFNLEIKENGVWVQKSQLPNNVTLAMSYYADKLPAGFDEQLLGVAFFAPEVNGWVFDDAAVTDTENKLIYIETSHLSPHLVGINPQVDDFAEDFGIKLEQYEDSRKTIRIEESTGNLCAKFVDFSLPTPGNLVFGITRIYNTRTAEVDQINESFIRDDSVTLMLNSDDTNINWHKYKKLLLEDECFAAFGKGWRLNLPYICSEMHFHDFNGRAQQLTHGLWKWEIGTTHEYHGINDFTIEKTDDDIITIVLKNGIKMTFQKVVKTITYKDELHYGNTTEELILEQGRLIRIEDTISNYYQEISYIDINTSDNNPYFLIKLDKIKDSLNRELSFTYGTTGINEVFLTLPGQQSRSILKYTYDESNTVLKTVNNNLTNQNDVYDYQEKKVRRGKTIKGWGFAIFASMKIPTGDSDSNSDSDAEVEVKGLYIGTTNIKGMQEYRIKVLNKITDELQKSEVFQYEVKEFLKQKKEESWGFISYKKTKYKSYYDVFVVNRSYQKAGDVVRNNINYDYYYEMESIGDNSDFNLRLRKSVFNLGQTRIVHYFTEKGNKNSLSRKETYFGPNEWELVESETFDYSDYGNDVWKINYYQHYKNGKTVTEKYDYDDWGNMKYKSSTGGDPNSPHDDLEEWFIYANTTPTDIDVDGIQNNIYTSSVPEKIHDRLVQRVALVHSPVTSNKEPGAYLKEEIFRYDSSGRMDRQAVWDGSKWLETQFVYDDGATKPKQIIDPLNRSMGFEYDIFGNVTKTEKLVEDADGNSETIITESGYDPIWGWKLWEKDGRGYTTVYRYTQPDGTIDYRGRVWEVEFPDDNDTKGWDPRTGTVRTGNPKLRTLYDDAALTKTVFDQLNNKTVYQFDNFGTLSSVVKFRKTGTNSYEPYATTRVTYNERGKINTITDPLENTTRFEYDDLGNTKKIIFPDADNPSKNINYDFATGYTIVTNERGFETAEQRDALGRIIRQEARQAGGAYTHAVTQYFYDGVGNIVKKIDPKGSETLYVYDSLGLLRAEVLPEETFLENGVQVTLRPVINYEYNAVGQKTAEVRELPGGKIQRTIFKNDSLGRLIETSTSVTNHLGEVQTVKTKTYYDQNGNKKRYLDANNVGLPIDQQKAYTYDYSAMNLLLSEIDPLGNKTTYTYDAVGNKTSITDPRGNSGKYSGDFTTILEYDDLYRLIAKHLPASPGETKKPVISYKYYVNGRLREQIEPDGCKTSYTYWPRGWVKTMTVEGDGQSYVTEYAYDAAGNETGIKDPRGFTTTKEYDALNRLTKVTYPEGNLEQYEYDLNGNRTSYINGRFVRTRYNYDHFNRLKEVKDGLENKTTYHYDRWGNMTRMVNAMDHFTDYQYDELNRLVAETDPLKQVKRYGYDPAGNRIWSLDPNGTESSYEYFANNLLKKITLLNTNINQSQVIEYQYDEAGYRILARNDSVTTRYNTTSGSYIPDPFGRIFSESKSFDGKTFNVEYQYDIMGRVTGVKYPTGNWVKYEYNKLGQLTKVPGYIEEKPSYDQGGLLVGLNAANGVNTAWEYDRNGRLTKLGYNNQNELLKEYSYTYDGANNIIQKNNDTYQYDLLNQLIYANLHGNFETNPEEDVQKVGLRRDDFQPKLNPLEFSLEEVELIELDYAAGSIGVDLLDTLPVTKVTLTPNSPIHRVRARNLLVGVSEDNSTYNMVDDWKVVSGEKGVLEIVFDNPKPARYIKIKCLFDNRTDEFAPVDMATFINAPGEIIKVHYLVTSRQESYAYDAIGNRKTETITQRYPITRSYDYYPNSSRLKSNGKYNFEYDNNGNLVKKTAVDGSVTWEYQYDLLNRLESVTRNGVQVASYIYDESGLRLKKQGKDKAVYYVFDTGGNVLYEQENREYLEYIYVLGKHFARVDGNLDNSIRKKYFYQTDHLGSTVLVTDEARQHVWSAEYTTFGIKTTETGTLKRAGKFTGKDLDEDTGLYYYNARWMDPETGRFISEDTVPVDPNDPRTLNFYMYCWNNPINYIDPTGNTPYIHHEYNRKDKTHIYSYFSTPPHLDLWAMMWGTLTPGFGTLSDVGQRVFISNTEITSEDWRKYYKAGDAFFDTLSVFQYTKNSYISKFGKFANEFGAIFDVISYGEYVLGYISQDSARDQLVNELFGTLDTSTDEGIKAKYFFARNVIDKLVKDDKLSYRTNLFGGLSSYKLGSGVDQDSLDMMMMIYDAQLVAQGKQSEKLFSTNWSSYFSSQELAVVLEYTNILNSIVQMIKNGHSASLAEIESLNSYLDFLANQF